ncbi:uncharacterized protein MELLADRAFT_95210 [Melampsora larici-populina 98AG31]|uniref:Secreted protein n=1 Tax=Melampsora larici-populina (strain 98AG31 / pathotype 3-4-7) TaxID=747676 RepID=F4RCI9_MELLP|nr:uncharacterized protein MELLADRAFT_95210 [Melampsora larici-populina 98AG31]EGG09956.1 hypothetical protein MELLADRAFT_95210 [Melampsora larici-populina 98AG31]
MMAHLYFLSFYLALVLLPAIHSLPLLKPLLDTPYGYQKVAKIDEGDPANLVLSESFTKLRTGKQAGNRGQRTSFFGITKGNLKNLLTKQPQNPENEVLASWEICYDIAQKAVESSQSNEVKEMANAVLRIGPEFDLHQYHSQEEMQHLKFTINLFSMYLEVDSLNPAERIWAVGALSYLRSRVPGSRALEMPGFWTANALGRFRSNSLLFFLKDKDLGKVAQEMWSEVPPKVETSELVTQEAIQREAIVHLIKRRISEVPGEQSIEFDKLFLDFINLETPIDSQKASSLMTLIINNLEHPERQRWSLFDEEANIVRLLLHLEEYHSTSYKAFGDLTKADNDIRKRILDHDISFQLDGEKLPPSAINLLREFQNIKSVHEDHIPKILEVLKEEEISVPELGRFFRALNLVFQSDREMVKPFILQLDGYYRMIPELVDKLLDYRLSRVIPGPKPFLWENLESLIILKSEDIVAVKYIDDLAEDLVSRGVLTKSETARQYFAGESKEVMVDRMLHGIFKKMLEAKKHNPHTDDVLVEYILHLIAFKNDRTELHYHLLDLVKDPEQLPLRQTLGFGPLRKQVLNFVADGQISEFSKALKKLEETIQLLLSKPNHNIEFPSPSDLTYKSRVMSYF